VIDHLGGGMHELVGISRTMARHEITNGVIGQIKVAIEILAYRCDSLYVLLPLDLVLGVGDAGAVTLGYVRPFKEQLLPVDGTHELDGRIDDGVHGIAVHLTNDPVPSITLGIDCLHYILVIRVMPLAT
jgi:hypothetical protein